MAGATGRWWDGKQAYDFGSPGPGQFDIRERAAEVNDMTSSLAKWLLELTKCSAPMMQMVASSMVACGLLKQLLFANDRCARM